MSEINAFVEELKTISDPALSYHITKQGFVDKEYGIMIHPDGTYVMDKNAAYCTGNCRDLRYERNGYAPVIKPHLSNDEIWTLSCLQQFEPGQACISKYWKNKVKNKFTIEN